MVYFYLYLYSRVTATFKYFYKALSRVESVTSKLMGFIFMQEFTKEELKNEEWRDVVGYEGLYLVSDLGRVKSSYIVSRAKDGIIKMGSDKNGYCSFALWKDKSQITKNGHRVVAKAFLPNPKNKPCVNHIDGDKRNNRTTNLEWVTYKENSRHAIETGLYRHPEMKKGYDSPHSKEVYQLTVEGVFIKAFGSSIEAAISLFGDINRGSIIRKCCRDKSSSYKGFLWRYPKDVNKDAISKHKRIIQQFSLEGILIKEYTGTSAAQKATGVLATGIGNNANGRTNTAGGFVWKYKYDYNSI